MNIQMIVRAILTFAGLFTVAVFAVSSVIILDTMAVALILRLFLVCASVAVLGTLFLAAFPWFRAFGYTE